MQINPHTYEAYQLLHNGTLALARAELQGFRVDTKYVEEQKADITLRIRQKEKEFKESNLFRHWQHSTKGKVNIYSNTQLAHFLYDVKKIEPQRETYSGQGSTDEESLQQLGLPELNNLIEIRKLKKVRDTYLEAFTREQVNGIIHPFFNLHLVRTYRSSSDSPNFQNIPKRDEESMRIVRQALYPRPDHQLLEIDYSGLEVRIAACYHRDMTMLKYLRDNYDMHGDMAEQIFKLDKFDKTKHNILRQATKNGFVFPEFYGDYYGNCAVNMACGWGKLPQGFWSNGQGILIGDNDTLGSHLIREGISSYTKFEKHVKEIETDFWQNRFPEYAQWKERWYTTYKKHGYIDLLTGFRCSGVMSKNDCINYPVQGAAFHCLLWSFIEMDRLIRELNLDSHLIGQIHDSMLMDVNPNELDKIIQLVREVTCHILPKVWSWIIVPLDVEMEICPVNESWLEKSKVR